MSKQQSDQQQLIDTINLSINEAASSNLLPVADALLEQYGCALQGILYYGSCLRSDNPYEGLIDLYVLVDRYSAAYPGKRLLAGFNKLLAPNVFYLEVAVEADLDKKIRAKYAVISLDDFEQACSKRWFHSYIWGRFCQPSRLLYVRNEMVKQRIGVALADAVTTFFARVLPALDTQFDLQTLWVEGLRLSYRTELRPEQPGRTAQLFQRYQDYYANLADCVLPQMEKLRITTEVSYHSNYSATERKLANISWAVRRVQGKILSIARLVKALFTFQGGVDYIVWKIERHAKVKIEITEQLRHYPLIFGWGVLLRLYRQGVFRS